VSVRHDVEVAFVGSGPGTASITRRLAASFVHTSVFDPWRAEHAAEPMEHATVCDSLEELRSRADVVVTFFSTEQALSQVLFEPGGLTAASRKPLSILELSPILPWAFQDIVVSCRAAGVFVVGGRLATLCKEGRVGANLYVDDQVRHGSQLRFVVEALADEVVWTGNAGSAKALGTLSDLLVGVNTAVAHEALQIGQGVGLDTDTLIRLLLKGSGATRVIAQLAAQRVPDGDIADQPFLCAGLLRAVSAAQHVDHSLLFGSLGVASLLRHAHASLRKRPAKTANTQHASLS